MRRGIVHLDPESGVWIAEVPSLPGCVSDGETREAAIRNLADAVSAWIAAAAVLGRKIPGEVPMELVEIES